MQHIYISPHFDDAILSCGGLINVQRSRGESVANITLFAGIPDYSRLSSFAKEYHTGWGNPSDPITVRRAEDTSVLTKWGVTPYYLDTLDSIYRYADDQVAYPDSKALFSEPLSDEKQLFPELWGKQIEQIASNSSDSVIYAPLAAGNHVDHQLARLWAVHLKKNNWQVWFYEDFPHAELAGLIEQAQSWFGNVTWHNKTVSINVQAKLDAIRGYKSQVLFMFENDADMVRRVKQFTAVRALALSRGERIRLALAGSDGRRARLWRRMFGYHAHAERIWTFS